MRYSDSTKALFTALLKFHDEVESIKKDATNPHFRSKYAKLEDCLSVTRPALKANNLVVVQPTSFVDGVVVLHTRVTHVSSGEWMESDWPLIPSKNDPQGMGSANTYGRRYNYMGTLGLDAEDDDGNDASRRPEPKPAPPPPPQIRAASKGPPKEDVPHPADEYAPSYSGEGDNSAGEYVITIGATHKGKRVKDIAIDRALQWAGWLEGEALTKKQPLSPPAQEAIKHIRAYAKGISVDQADIENIPF